MTTRKTVTVPGVFSGSVAAGSKVSPRSSPVLRKWLGLK